MTNGIKPIGDWPTQIKNPLKDALRASVEICGRTGAEACKHAIILMAQSAVAMTKQAPKNRKVEQDPRIKGKGGQFARVFKKTGGETKFYRLSMDEEKWRKVKLIANRGLAKKSWMWGLRGLGKPSAKPIPGVAWITTLATKNVGGYILNNALSYLLKILPAGWEQVVQQKAANKIMKQAVIKIERNFMAEMRKTRRTGMAVGAGLSKYFLKV
ncbi:MAG: hypothetical protein PHH96_02180 [Smithellaceae bacterium]|jgi:hypothetical protein|nr:hypothetical protein [Smithellaceae bacterium]MDD5413609.1 hypothetical protein [Smithellaceae bacterium]